MIAAHVQRWANAHPLTPKHVDCSTAVMLKILDGKCKMTAADKQLMSLLYDAIKHRAGELFAADMHAFIAEVRDRLDEPTRNAIYERRVLAETMISRPVMKQFKAMIREQGLFDASRDA